MGRAALSMHRNQLIPRRYPVLAQIAHNERKNCVESRLSHHQTSASHSSSRSKEYVHATVEDDLIGPGHIKSRSRSRSRSRKHDHDQQRSASKAVVKPGLEIHMAQRGRYIVVEDVGRDRYAGSKQYPARSRTPEFVLVNKENGRAIPLHSIYQNPDSRRLKPFDPPVDYNDQPPPTRRHPSQSNRSSHQLRKARSMSDIDEDSRRHGSSTSASSTDCSSRYKSVTNLTSSLCLNYLLTSRVSELLSFYLNVNGYSTLSLSRVIVLVATYI